MNKDIFVQLLGQRQFKAVRSILDVMNEVDIASLLSELDDKELALAFRLIPKDKAAEVFANMETSMQTYLVDMFSEKELKELLDDLYMDDTVDLLEELPANLVNRILDTVSPSDRTLINQLLNYPEDSAGSIMTTEYVDIRQSMTVAQSMAHIKETGIHKETIYTCYVTDKRKLIGIVSAKDLMTTDDGILISELMETEIISVRTYTDKEEVAQLFRKYDLLALPVLDKDGKQVTKGRMLDFMGFQFHHDRTTIRKSNIEAARRKANHISKQSKISWYNASVMLSYMGLFKHTDTYNYYIDYIKPKINVKKLKRIVSKHSRKENEHDRLEKGDRNTAGQAGGGRQDIVAVNGLPA